jgi:hypothetical protein
VPLAVEEDEAPGAIDVAVHGAPGVVAHAEEVPQLVEETGACAVGPGAKEVLRVLLRRGWREQLLRRLTQDNLIEEAQRGPRSWA